MVAIHVTNRAGEKHNLKGQVNQTLMEVLRDHSMDVEAICGGVCSCATCHVFVEPSWAAKLPPLSSDELELVKSTDAYRENSSRLSCQIRLRDDLEGITITVAPAE
jgi:2Fe-2S ferredoxin